MGVRGEWIRLLADLRFQMLDAGCWMLDAIDDKGSVLIGALQLPASIVRRNT